MSTVYPLTHRFLDFLTACLYRICQVLAWAWNRAVGKGVEVFTEEI